MCQLHRCLPREAGAASRLRRFYTPPSNRGEQSPQIAAHPRLDTTSPAPDQKTSGTRLRILPRNEPTGADRSLGAGSQRVDVEVALQRSGGRAVLVRPVQKIHQDLPGSRDLAQTGDRSTMTRICQSEIQQFKGAMHRTLGDGCVSRSPAQHSTDLTADMTQLLGQGQLPPATGGELSVGHDPHRRTSRRTKSVILSRVAASSTPRDRLPTEGRMLIIESNSSHSASSSSG